jgi:hypothetical protein
MFNSRFARSVRAIVLAMSVALVPAAGLVVLAPAAHAEGGGKEWTGDGDGHLWSDDNNWSGNEAPKDGDGVIIHSPDSHGSAVHVVGVPNISLDSLSLSADGTAVVSLEGGSVDIASSFDWSSGTLGVDVNLGPLAHGSIGSGGMKSLDGDISVGLGSVLTMSGVSGTSALVMSDPHTITIGTGAVLATIGTNEISALACCVNPAKLINHGLIEMGPGSMNLSTVEYDQTGRLDATFGPTMTVADAPAKITSGARFSGTGRFVLGGRTQTTVGNSIRIGGKYVVEQAGGTLAGSAKLNGGGIWQLTGGTQFGTLTNQTGNLLQVIGPNPKALGALTATQRGKVDNHGVVEISGGTVSMASNTRFVNEPDATMRLVPGVTLDGTSCCVTPALLENHGSLSVTAPATHEDPVLPVTITHAGLFSDAPVLISPEQTLELTNGPSQLAAGTTLGGGGTLGISSGFIGSGNIAIQAGSTVHLHDSADLTGDGLTLGGPGSTVQWDGGTIRGNVEFPTGTTVDIAGPSAKKVGAPAAGTTHLTTAGSTTIEAGADVDHRTTVGVDSAQRWTNTGSLTVEGNTALASGSCCVSPARLENASGATLEFAPATGTTVEDTGVEVHNLGGQVTATGGTTNIRYPSYIQESGTTTVASGARFGQTNFSSPMVILGGSVTGTGTLMGTVQNDGGTVAPGASAAAHVIGTLSVVGQYYQGPGGHLTADIAATSRDVLAVGGAVRLAGVVTGVVKGTAPTDGATVTVLTAATLSGRPDCTFTTGPEGPQWAAGTTSTTLTLTAGAAEPTGCDVFTPLTPTRLDGTGTTVAPGTDVLVQVTGTGGVPATGVDAVALSVSVDGASADGALTVGPSGAAVPTGQALRFSAGMPVSNAATVRVGSDGRILLHVTGGSANVHLDVLGWYGDAQHTTGGSLFHAVTPTLIRSASVSSSKDVDVVVANKGGVPSAGATSVTVALSIRSGATAGSISVVPGGASAGTTTTQSYGTNQTVEAVATVAQHAGKIRLHVTGGTAQVGVRVLGYTIGRAGGGSFLKLANPTRVDSFTTSTSPTFDGMGGLGGISQYGAVAYVVAVHAENPSARGILNVGSAAADAPLVPTVSLRTAHVDASGALVAVGSDNDALRYQTTAGSTGTRVDLQGWYVG